MASVGSQFSTGDQGDNRRAFWRSGYSLCCKCGAKAIESKDHVAGCRHNGDAYGTTVFTCKECNWTTSFQYDDAAETYYYETSRWRQEAAEARRSGQTG
ncbi:hypothetical protein AB1Y20_017774 [Prymnesium parvum]|uniref:60S ribosomal export protein NMD3 n=1 Tax=Prymnesium parvum TaxID=97485 RepID=A0AB34JQ34_PRYPA|mmetsp:Transcript_47173/g.116748  ORF Transcript_47173/g.116748 Transcript_47173/m.116748 type:complete len:99 (-) Transcript_47173:300-596(-)